MTLVRFYAPSLLTLPLIATLGFATQASAAVDTARLANSAFAEAPMLQTTALDDTLRRTLQSVPGQALRERAADTQRRMDGWYVDELPSLVEPAQ